MKLPLVDEIREARRLAEEAHLATMHLHRIDHALTSVDVMERQVRLRPTLEGRIPGDDVLEVLVDSWPQLSDLASHAPRPGEPVPQQLVTRRAQLELARQVLRPLAAEAQARGAELHQMQHDQRHSLEDPRYAADVAELAEIGAERDRLALEMTPLNNRLALVEPAQGLLDTFVARLDRSQLQGDREDPQGHLAWRAVHLARSFVESFHDVLERLHLEVPIPEAPEVPAHPSADAALCAAAWAEVERARAQLEELQTILGEEGANLRRTRDAQQQRHEELTQRILERMG